MTAVGPVLWKTKSGSDPEGQEGITGRQGKRQMQICRFAAVEKSPDGKENVEKWVKYFILWGKVHPEKILFTGR